MRYSAAHASAVLLFSVGLAAGGGCAGHHNDYLVVRQDSRTLTSFTLRQLQDLPQVEIVTPQSRGAVRQKGPTVHSILDAAGAIDVRTVRIEGRDPAQTFVAAELTDELILNVTKRKTLKLVGTKLDVGRWVRDVTSSRRCGRPHRHR
jgi:hypothetical protein